MECKICLDGEINKNDLLVTPCNCEGTNKYIHTECLKQWIKSEANIHHKKSCRECGCNYVILKRFHNEKNKLLIFDENDNLCTYLFLGSLLYLLLYVINDDITLYITNLICFNNYKRKLSHFTDILFQDNMTLYVFNTSIYFFLIYTIFTFFYIYVCVCEIKRKKDYFGYMYKTILCSNVVSLLFIIILNVFLTDLTFPTDKSTIVKFNYLSIIYVFSYPTSLFIFIRNHEYVIDYINNNYNNIIITKDNSLYEFIANAYYEDDANELLFEMVVAEYNGFVDQFGGTTFDYNEKGIIYLSSS